MTDPKETTQTEQETASCGCGDETCCEEGESTTCCG